VIEDLWILEQSFAYVEALKNAFWLARESHHSGLVVLVLLSVSWCDSRSASGILQCRG